MLYIGCANGLNKYNRQSDNFIRYFPDEKKPESEANVDYIGGIAQDGSGRIWIGTWNEGLFYYDEEKDTFHKYDPHPDVSKSFINQFTSGLLAFRMDGIDYLWFASYQYGLYKINIGNGKITGYNHQPENPTSLIGNRIRTIYTSGIESGEIWLGTESGLDHFDSRTENFTHYRPGKKGNPGETYVWSVFKDNSNLIWAGSAGGIYRFNVTSLAFNTLRLDSGEPGALSGQVVWAIHESKIDRSQAELWLGTEDGLYRFNRHSRRIIHYQHDPQNRHSLSDNVILSLIETQSEEERIIWAGTENGLNKIHEKTAQIRRYSIPTKDPVHNMIYTLCGDKDGNIWIVYVFSGEAVDRYGRERYL